MQVSLDAHAHVHVTSMTATGAGGGDAGRGPEAHAGRQPVGTRNEKRRPVGCGVRGDNARGYRLPTPRDDTTFLVPFNGLHHPEPGGIPSHQKGPRMEPSAVPEDRAQDRRKRRSCVEDVKMEGHVTVPSDMTLSLERAPRKPPTRRLAFRSQWGFVRAGEPM